MSSASQAPPLRPPPAGSEGRTLGRCPHRPPELPLHPPGRRPRCHPAGCRSSGERAVSRPRPSRRGTDNPPPPGLCRATARRDRGAPGGQASSHAILQPEECRKARGKRGGMPAGRTEEEQERLQKAERVPARDRAVWKKRERQRGREQARSEPQLPARRALFIPGRRAGPPADNPRPARSAPLPAAPYRAPSGEAAAAGGTPAAARPGHVGPGAIYSGRKRRAAALGRRSPQPRALHMDPAPAPAREREGGGRRAGRSRVRGDGERTAGQLALRAARGRSRALVPAAPSPPPVPYRPDGSRRVWGAAAARRGCRQKSAGVVKQWE